MVVVVVEARKRSGIHFWGPVYQTKDGKKATPACRMSQRLATLSQKSKMQQTPAC